MAKGVDAYRLSLRGAVRALWSGTISYGQFFEMMSVAINRYIALSYYEGALECGIAQGELTPAERIEMQTAIVSELSFVTAFADAIVVGSKARGGKLSPQLDRVERWVQRYSDVQSRARVSVCSDQKLEWILGDTIEHCTSCLKLSGKVKRASYWQRMGVYPQNPPNPNLECEGWGACQLLPTDRPSSKGPLPRLP
jgi:hypothetical protein